MTKKIIIATVLLFVLALLGLNVDGQTLYVPGSLGTSTTSNVGIGRDNPSTQFEVSVTRTSPFSNKRPEMSLLFIDGARRPSTTYEWKYTNRGSYLDLAYELNGSANSICKFYADRMFLDGAQLIIEPPVSNNKVFTLGDIPVTLHGGNLDWDLGVNSFRLFDGNLELTNGAKFLLDATSINDWGYAIHVNSTSTSIKAFVAALDGYDRAVILSNGFISGTDLQVRRYTSPGVSEVNFRVNEHGSVYANNYWILDDQQNVMFEVISNGRLSATTLRTIDQAGDNKFVVNGSGHIYAKQLWITDDLDQPNFIVDNDGYVYAREINVKMGALPDYVFEDDYELMSFQELRAFIGENGHLPGVPSAEEVSDNGMEVAQMNAVLLEKVEELTLYVLQLEEELNELKNESNESENSVK